jgi:hypothetical protein
MKKPARPDPNTSHLAGEYFVAAELSKRGWAVAMTIGNAKAIDLFVEKGRRTAKHPGQVHQFAQARRLPARPSRFCGAGRKWHVSVYLVDLTAEQEARAIREFQEVRRMRQWREGKWLCWQTRPSFDTRKECIAQLCQLGAVLAELFKAPPLPAPAQATPQ